MSFNGDNPQNRNNKADTFRLRISEDELNNSSEFTGANQRRSEREYMDSNPYYSDKKNKQEKKEHKKRDKIKSRKNRIIFRVVWIAMVVLVGLTLASYLITGSNDFFAISRSTEGSAQVTIPANVTVDELSDMLKTDGVIKEPTFFKIYCSLTTKMEYFEPGTFNVATNLDYEAIINYLQGGNTNVETVDVTFQEGMNLLEIAAKLEENGVCNQADFLEACKSDGYDNYDIIGEITNASEKYYKLEGYLFPDTYTFYKGEDMESLIGKLLYNFQTKVTSDMLADINDSQYSMDQIVTLASIIQSEAANVDDMYMISAILHNRLESGDSMNIYSLGCDSTIYYPYRSKSDVPSDMGDYTSNYDTYNIQGLPAGAICNPGLDALKAAIKPDPDGAGYYYFCHSAEGTPYYAQNEDEHQYNLSQAGLN